MIRYKTPLMLAGCLMCISSQGIANEKAVAAEFFDGSTLAFDYKGSFSNGTLSVTGPNGFSTSVFKKSGAPALNLALPVRNNTESGSLNATLAETTPLADGEYNYQITVATDEIIEVTDKLNNGRGKNAKTTMNVGETQSGFFRVKDGAIVKYANIKEGE